MHYWSKDLEIIIAKTYVCYMQSNVSLSEKNRTNKQLILKTKSLNLLFKMFSKLKNC